MRNATARCRLHARTSIEVVLQVTWLAAGTGTVGNRTDHRSSSGKTLREMWVSALLMLLIGPAGFGQADVGEDPHAARVYVDATHGSDSNPGTADHPLSSLQEAIGFAVKNNQHGVATRLILRGGVYREALLLPEDANSTGAPISFEATPGENVTISGADVMAGWQADPSDPAVYSHSWTFNTALCATPQDWPEIKEIVRHREIIIVNGMPLKQVLSFKELAPGSFYGFTPAGGAGYGKHGNPGLREQAQSAYNGHFELTCYHPLLLAEECIGTLPLQHSGLRTMRPV